MAIRMEIKKSLGVGILLTGMVFTSPEGVLQLAMAASGAAPQTIGQIMGGSSKNRPPLVKKVTQRTWAANVPGVLSLTAEKYCGDGDVSRYATNNPDVTFLDGSTAPQTINAVVGYWVAPATGSQVPTAGNGLGAWIPIGYGNVTVDPAYANPPSPPVQKLNVANKAAVSGATEDMIIGTFTNLMSQAKAAYQFSSATTKYNLYLGTMVCSGLVDSSGTGLATNQASSSEVEAALINLSKNTIPLNLAVGIYNPWHKYDVSYNSTTNTASIVPNATGAGDISGEQLYSLAMDVLNQVALLGATKTKLQAIQNKLNSGTQCSDLNSITGLASAVNEQGRWFEPFPMQLTCKVLDAAAPGFNFKTADVSDLTPVAKTGTREQIAQSLILAAYLNHIQNDTALASGSFTPPKARCFDPANPYFHKVLGSVTVPLKVDPVTFSLMPQANPSEMVHPEGSFAISYHTYYDYPSSGGNEKAVFGMNSYNTTIDPLNPALGASFTPGQGSQPNSVIYPTVAPTTFKSVGLSIHYHIRHIGCPNDSNSYCMK